MWFKAIKAANIIANDFNNKVKRSNPENTGTPEVFKTNIYKLNIKDF